MISGMLARSTTKGQSADVDRMVKKYGIPMLITSDDNLKEYISTILSQVQGMFQFLALASTLIARRQADSQNGS